MTRLSIFHPAGRLELKANPFGKDVANMELFQALARHGGLEQMDVLSQRAVTEADAARDLLGDGGGATRVTVGSLLNTAIPLQSGALLRGQPYLEEMAWMRRRAGGDRSYSLLGLVHTLAPLVIRQQIAAAATAPVYPWDALICTSPDVQQALGAMFDAWGDHLGARTGGGRPPQPSLPLVPLGVDGPNFAKLADRPEVRARLRAELALADTDVLVLWVGRLSFYEKAFPQPMFRALQAAAEQTGARVSFAMAGWFPEERDAGLYQAAAKTHAPDVAVHFLDGNDRVRVGELWAASDIFLSLVDNIQETFGLTPLEAMAAGLPVVASDWDGYRYTVRDGIEGFLVPTLGGPTTGLGASMVARHLFQIDSYQAYAGTVAQHTAVHIGRCAQALAELIRSPELRRRMGQAGRERIRMTFDWPVIARQVRALVDDLGRVRAAGADPAAGTRLDPVKGDPFADFAGFASQTLGADTRLSVPDGITQADVLRAGAVQLDAAFRGWRGTLAECARAFELVASGQAGDVRQVLLAFPAERRAAMEISLAWMAKLGWLDWLD